MGRKDFLEAWAFQFPGGSPRDNTRYPRYLGNTTSEQSIEGRVDQAACML